MTFDIDQIYKNLLGRGVQDEGKNYWTSEYDKAIAGGTSSADAIRGIRGAIKQSDEYSTPTASHRRAAMDSISKGKGVRDGTVASYSDMFTPDGTQRDDWVDEKTWLQDKVYKQHEQIQAGGGGTGGMSDDRYNALLGNFNTLTGTLNSLKDSFAKNQKDMQAMYNNANWGAGGYGQQSQTVSGVKTQNELPGYKPKTGGSSGFFGRGGNRFGLSTSSLNI